MDRDYTVAARGQVRFVEKDIQNSEDSKGIEERAVPSGKS